jgi:RNA polymerase sigma factor (sigma-70 family)
LTDSDRDLASRFAGHGDEEAFRLLYRRHTPRLYAVALRVLGGRHADAEDVVQETWIRAARRVATFEWRSSLTTWLIGIAINCAREATRARGVDAGTAAPQPIDAASPSDPATIDLERAIGALPDRQRMVLVLHDVEGWTHAEIARSLDVPPGTSKSDLFRARQFVRACLRRDANEEGVT